MSRKNKKKELIRFTKRSKRAKDADNKEVYKKVMYTASQHDCPICPPWKGENRVHRITKHGTKKPKYKNKRG